MGHLKNPPRSHSAGGGGGGGIGGVPLQLSRKKGEIGPAVSHNTATTASSHSASRLGLGLSQSTRGGATVPLSSSLSFSATQLSRSHLQQYDNTDYVGGGGGGWGDEDHLLLSVNKRGMIRATSGGGQHNHNYHNHTQYLGSSGTSLQLLQQAQPADQNAPSPKFLTSYSGLLTEAEIYQQQQTPPNVQQQQQQRYSPTAASSSFKSNNKLLREEENSDAADQTNRRQRRRRHIVAIASSLPSREEEALEKNELLLLMSCSKRRPTVHSSDLRTSGANEDSRRTTTTQQQKMAATSVMRPQSSPYRVLGIVRPESGSVRVGVSSPIPHRRPATASALLMSSIRDITVELSQQRPPSALVHDARTALRDASQRGNVTTSANSHRGGSSSGRPPSSSSATGLSSSGLGASHRRGERAGPTSASYATYGSGSFLPPRPSSSSSASSMVLQREQLDLGASGSLPALVRQALQSA